MFIVVEGLDGAGKSTQISNLREMFAQRGIDSEYIHYPRYDSPIYGELISRFLRGELGSLEQVNPYLVALLFAGDRLDGASQIREWMAEGKVVIADRYVFSNIGYQCGKLASEEERERLKEWILHLEYEYNKISKPDFSIFLDVPFAFTERKLTEVREGDDRDYLNGVKDIHEESLSLQRSVRSVYIDAAKSDKTLFVVDCSDEQGAMGSPELIFEKIKELINPVI